MTRIVEIEVGHDVTGARAIAASCRMEGMHVELLEFDHFGAYPTVGCLAQHRLLVRSEDAERVVEIVGPTLMPNEATTTFGRRPTWMRVMALVIVLPIVLQMMIFVVGFVLGRF